jgi:predicted RNA binding protein YcfA (HicA-like mRNA interferase family)
MLLRAGFVWIRSKGSHRIYPSGRKGLLFRFTRVHTLHPKIAKEVLDAIAESSGSQTDRP